MKKNNIKNKNDENDYIASRTILLFAAVVSLYFNSGLADPFNSPKQWLLILSCAWLLGYLVLASKRQLKFIRIEILTFLVTVFQLFSFVNFILSDVKFVTFFGETQRKLGFITYFCLSIYMLFAAKYLNLEKKGQIYSIFLLTGTIFSSYALMQYSGNDFIKWSNPYNVIISTLGNPNFAGAFMAVMASFCFSALFLKSMNKYLKLCFLLVTVTLLILIYLSNAKQGLISAAVGVLFIVCAEIYKRKKIIGIVLSTIVGVTGVASVLGMLQIGPLTNFLYKDSVTLRGYYWRAGINMFLHHPIFGVGLDRYGANFNQYKDAGFVNQRGPELMSSNAHNIPIQIFATGGMLLGVTYLALFFYITYRGINGLKKLDGDNQVLLLGLVAAWLAYLAQSLVSIENIGMAVWGWLIGGAIIGITKFNDESLKPTTVAKKAFQPILSMCILIPTIVLIFTLSKGETNMMKAQSIFNPKATESSQDLYIISNQIVNDRATDPFYKITAANFLIFNGNAEDGIKALKNILLNDKRNTNVLSSLARYYEFNEDLVSAINYRIEISIYDPYNVNNYLKLANLYNKNGESNNRIQMLNKILTLAPSSEAATTAKSELVN